MSEHTEQTVAPADAVPARIQLDDFIEAVSRGVARALEAEEDVSGHAMAPPRSVSGPIVIGLYYPNNPGDSFGGGGSSFDPTTPIREGR